jgi:hypothetical protein
VNYSLTVAVESLSTLQQILKQRVKEVQRGLEVRGHRIDRCKIKVSYCN